LQERPDRRPDITDEGTDQSLCSGWGDLRRVSSGGRSGAAAAPTAPHKAFYWRTNSNAQLSSAAIQRMEPSRTTILEATALGSPEAVRASGRAGDQWMVVPPSPNVPVRTVSRAVGSVPSPTRWNR